MWCYGIFTKNEKKSNQLFFKIVNEESENIKFLLKNIEKKNIILKDGTEYEWIKPIAQNKGFRCNRVFIDEDLTESEIVLVSEMGVYCSRNDVIIF